MDSFDPFAGFETELKGSLPKQNGANNAAPMPGGGGGDINTPKAGFSGGGNVKSPTSILPSKSIMSSSSSQQQPMTNKGMPVMGSGYVPQQQSHQRNAPMPSSFALTFQPQQQPQQKPPMMMMQQQQQPQWGGTNNMTNNNNNNNWQQPPKQQPPMPFQQQQQQQTMQPTQMQYPANAPFQHQQQQMFQQQQQTFGMQMTPNAQTQQQKPVMQNPQPQQYPMQQKQMQQKQMQQAPSIQQKPIAAAAAAPQQPQQQKPVVAASQQPKPVVPKQQSQDEYEYDAVFARIPSIVHTKSVASSNDGADGTLPHSNSDGEISQLNDDTTLASFCPPPPPSVAPPPPPPAAEQVAFQNALLAPSPSSPSTNLADYDIFGGLFDSAQFPAAATSTPPSTPYDFNHMKSMDSGPDGYLASNPSIDDDYLFSEDEDDVLDQDDPFGVFGTKPSPTPKEKASDVSSKLGITKTPTKGGEETKAVAAEKEQRDSRHEKHKLPSGGEFFDCKIYTSTVGVMFFSPFELTDSLYLNMDRETVINVLGQRPVVAHMLEESAAQSVGVQLGYVLLQVNGRDVKTPLEANLAIRESSRPMNLLFYILKDPIMVAEGQYMVKYNTRDTGAPPTSRDWKPKYCVVGGIIAHSHMLNMYRSKAEYDRAVMDTQSRRPVSVKVKQFSLIGARMWNEVGKENGISKPHIRKVKYRSQMKPWNYITVLPLKKDPIKISIPGSSSTDKDNGLQQLKLVHEGIRRVIHGQNNANNKNYQDGAGASSEQP